MDIKIDWVPIWGFESLYKTAVWYLSHTAACGRSLLYWVNVK